MKCVGRNKWAGERGGGGAGGDRDDGVTYQIEVSRQGRSKGTTPEPEGGNPSHARGGSTLQVPPLPGVTWEGQDLTKPCRGRPDKDLLQISPGYEDFGPLLDYVP